MIKAMNDSCSISSMSYSQKYNAYTDPVTLQCLHLSIEAVYMYSNYVFLLVPYTPYRSRNRWALMPPECKCQLERTHDAPGGEMKPGPGSIPTVLTIRW